MVINHSYTRTAPDGISTKFYSMQLNSRKSITVTPANQKEVEYYRSLEEIGYTYKQQYTIHNNMTECESCSA
jgi:hypothetical protein